MIDETDNIAEFMRHRPKHGPRIVLLDVETSLMLGYFFGTFKQNISLDCIKQDWNMLSFCAKWHHVPLVIYDDLREQKNPTNDKRLCTKLHRILREADVAIAHNGKRFDLRKIRARMAHNRMAPIPNIRIIDTLTESRKQFGFTSQKLIYLSEKFGPEGERKNEHGKDPGLKLWLACQNGDVEAWEEMRKYNIPDVTSMEGVYDELRGWFQGAQNLAVFLPVIYDPETEQHACPNCASTGVDRERGKYVYTQVGIYQRYHCNDCGGYSRGRTMVRSRDDRAHILMN